MRDGVAKCGNPVVMGLRPWHDTVMTTLSGRELSWWVVILSRQIMMLS